MVVLVERESLLEASLDYLINSSRKKKKKVGALKTDQPIMYPHSTGISIWVQSPALV